MTRAAIGLVGVVTGGALGYMLGRIHGYIEASPAQAKVEPFVVHVHNPPRERAADSVPKVVRRAIVKAES